MEYIRFDDNSFSSVEDQIISEIPLTIYVNKTELATLQCTPTKLNCLVAGFLYNEGFVRSMDEFAMLRVCEDDGTADVILTKEVVLEQTRRTITSGCGGGITMLKAEVLEPVESDMLVSTEQIFGYIRKLYEGAVLHRDLGGVHSSALAQGDNLLFLAEDIGRHNTIDKLAGECLLRYMEPAGKVLVTTGRISSDMLMKAAQMQIPVVVSRTSPTSLAVDLAKKLNVTVVGYVRGKSLNVYSGIKRIEGLAKSPVAKANR